MAAPMTIEYHQNRAQVAPDASVLVDFRCDEPMYQATRAVNGLWVVHGGGLHAGLKANVLTLLFRKCPVDLSGGPGLSRARGFGLFDVCLHAHDFLAAAVGRLHHYGVFTADDGALRTYTTMKALVNACDAAIAAHLSDPTTDNFCVASLDSTDLEMEKRACEEIRRVICKGFCKAAFAFVRLSPALLCHSRHRPVLLLCECNVVCVGCRSPREPSSHGPSASKHFSLP